MKVLLVISSLRGGGAERVMTWLADCLIDAGDSVCLITQHEASDDFYRLNPAVRRIAVGYGRFFDFPKVRGLIHIWRWRHALRTVARREQFDVVLSFIDKMNLSVLSAFAGTGIPVVVAERTDPRYSQLGIFGRTIRTFLYKKLAKRVVVQTDAIAARVRNEWGLYSVVVIPNAVLIRAASTPNQMNRRPCVLCVGRFSREKGHDLLIAAWGTLTSEFPDWQLRIVGEGPLRSALEEQVTRLGLAGSVSLPGMSSDVAEEYGAASIFALPSRFEGFPNALLEAMAFGCAPIATESAGASVEVIQSGVNGTLVAGDNVGALADELGRLMRDRNLRCRYAERAAEVATRYAPERIFHLWRQLLADAAGLT